MFPQKTQINPTVGQETYPLGESNALADVGAMALVALSHTPLEHRIYLTMLAERNGLYGDCRPINTRELMTLADIRSSGTVRRGLEGLIAKLSIERQNGANGGGAMKRYSVRTPEQILTQRRAMGIEMYPPEFRIRDGNRFERAITRVAANASLSRREAQVALCCVEGLTNAEIGGRLEVSEQTVKFHLRHIFIKFGVRRRAELISRLLT
jgi:DNA-binding CsgD family transcriptional regulator